MPDSQPKRPEIGSTVTFAKPELGQLIERLWQSGYTVVGPTIAQQAIVYDELRSLDQLPIGWTDEQEGGTYRLRRCADGAYFGYNVGPHSWKKYLFPPQLTLYSIQMGEGTFRVEPNSDAVPRYAFVGVRSCDLHAIAIQDRVFQGGPHVDPNYQARRDGAFIVAVNCAQAAPTCFCTSMNTGPKVQSGFDLALTELDDRFVVEVGTLRGAEMLDSIAFQPAETDDTRAAETIVARTAEAMVRHMQTHDLPGLLYDNLEHPRWDDVAQRCLSCANCTMVCPTCFCHAIEDVPDLEGQRSQRVRVWDSCFNPEHSYAAGGLRRPDIRSRYRQWLVHKLAAWIDQYDTSGCVGCGRCITWCPVAIDLTEEVAAIRGGDP